MAKQKFSYSCTNCGHLSSKWAGCCPICQEWNSFTDQIQSSPSSLATKAATRTTAVTALKQLHEISVSHQQRMCSGIKEWDRVLGGGILPGSFIILTGDPGIGKSTLLLQVAQSLAAAYDVLYFSSEESLEQVKGRAERLGVSSTRLLFSDEANLELILSTSLQRKPAILILDSIQNCHLSFNSNVIPGTVAQLREAAFILMRFAKENNIAVLITGHITKEGEMAGPKVLEHMVDAAFYLQAEDRWHTRILRSVKNRFGAINEVGFFQMEEQGLVEVSNINQQLLSEISTSPGSCLVSVLEGSRPLILELQALVVESKFGVPQRVVTGIDHKRVVLIAAILEKYMHIRFSAHDIFFKVSGGFKIKESGADLGIALALLSSYYQQALPDRSVAVGEVSLTGIIKPTNQISLLVREVEKFGMKHLMVSQGQQIKSDCLTTYFKHVYQLFDLFPEQ